MTEDVDPFGDPQLEEVLNFFVFSHDRKSTYKGAICFQLTYPDGHTKVKVVRVRPKEGVQCFNGRPSDVPITATVSMERDTFFDVYMARVHPHTAYMKRKLKVSAWEFADCLRFAFSFDPSPERWKAFYAAQAVTLQETNPTSTQTLSPKTFLDSLHLNPTISTDFPLYPSLSSSNFLQNPLNFLPLVIRKYTPFSFTTSSLQSLQNRLLPLVLIIPPIGLKTSSNQVNLFSFFASDQTSTNKVEDNKNTTTSTSSTSSYSAYLPSLSTILSFFAPSQSPAICMGEQQDQENNINKNNDISSSSSPYIAVSKTRRFSSSTIDKHFIPSLQGMIPIASYDINKLEEFGVTGNNNNSRDFTNSITTTTSIPTVPQVIRMEQEIKKMLPSTFCPSTLQNEQGDDQIIRKSPLRPASSTTLTVLNNLKAKAHSKRKKVSRFIENWKESIEASGDPSLVAYSSFDAFASPPVNLSLSISEKATLRKWSGLITTHSVTPQLQSLNSDWEWDSTLPSFTSQSDFQSE